MAMDRDELNKKRLARAAQRKKQLEQQRKLKLRLILAAVILVVCGVAIFALTPGGSDSPTVQQPSIPGQTLPPETAPPTEPPSRHQLDPTTVIHIKAAGDLNITDKVVAAGNSPLGYDFTKAFLDVAPVLADADLTMLNLEGIFVGEPYGTATRSAPRELLRALDASGVDLIQAANSYSVYDGISGLNTTLSAIRSAGMEPVGAFASNEEFRRTKGYTICDVQGIKVGVVAFTKGMDSLGLPAGSEDCVNVLYTDYFSTYKDVDTEGITQVLKDLRSEKPDVTIAMLHWGSEYNDTISESQEKIAKLMLDEGVDIILGTHSHMVHQVVFDEEKNTLVAYSLGDFFGDGEKGGSNYSIILDIELTRDNTTGITKITDYGYTPIYTLNETECDGQRRVVRIRHAMDAYALNYVDKVTKACYASMENSLKRINARVNGE